MPSGGSVIPASWCRRTASLYCSAVIDVGWNRTTMLMRQLLLGVAADHTWMARLRASLPAVDPSGCRGCVELAAGMGPRGERGLDRAFDPFAEARLLVVVLDDPLAVLMHVGRIAQRFQGQEGPVRGLSFGTARLDGDPFPGEGDGFAVGRCRSGPAGVSRRDHDVFPIALETVRLQTFTIVMPNG